jgi:hypothetical protein
MSSFRELIGSWPGAEFQDAEVPGFEPVIDPSRLICC